ncbi:MAG: tetratricopeptide repeat protein [Candidatus Methylumidiphilus sp.]
MLFKNVFWIIITMLLLVSSASGDFFKGGGLGLMLKGKTDEAIAEYTKEISLDPKYRSAYFMRGQLYVNKGKYDEAIADYTKAISLIVKPKSDDAPYYLLRGKAYHLKKEYDLAIIDYTTAINLNSGGIGDYCYNRGLAYQAKGERDNAIADFRRSIAAYQDSDYAKKDLEAAKLKLNEVEKQSGD